MYPWLVPDFASSSPLLTGMTSGAVAAWGPQITRRASKFKDASLPEISNCERVRSYSLHIAAKDVRH